MTSHDSNIWKATCSDAKGIQTEPSSAINKQVLQEEEKSGFTMEGQRQQTYPTANSASAVEEIPRSLDPTSHSDLSQYNRALPITVSAPSPAVAIAQRKRPQQQEVTPVIERPPPSSFPQRVSYRHISQVEMLVNPFRVT